MHLTIRLLDNKDSKLRYRADVLIEDYITKIESKINKEIDKAKKRYGDAFNEEEFRKTNARVLDNQKKNRQYNFSDEKMF